jgi:hypothetical protein
MKQCHEFSQNGAFGAMDDNIYIYDPIKHYSSPLFHAEYDDEAPVDLDKGIGHQER